MKSLLLLLLFPLATFLFAQPKQTIRGTILDKDSKMPLTGASVILVGSNPLIGTSSDAKGNFKLENVSAGRVSIQASFIGYNTVTLNNLILTSAKELVLHVEMEEKIISTKEIVVSANNEKDITNNKMASISARLFTIEETDRFAGSRGDVSRMAMNYAGVSGANDQRNDIIIRGNSPTGILWKIDDVEVPNPSHFAAQGTTGGPVSILNNNTLRNSDFMTGAFPAEYGNALSGVFDLKMRNGNNEKHEFTAVSGFNGFELGAEGPFPKQHNASYMAYYRYSVLDLMSKLGFNMGTSGIPRYQDFTFKINIPFEKASFSMFGIAGTSDIAMLDSKNEDANLYNIGKTDLYNGSDLATGAMSYTRNISGSTYIKFIVSGLLENARTKIDTLDLSNKPQRFFQENSFNYRASFSTILNSKINSKLSYKAGISTDLMGFNFHDKVYDAVINDFKIMLENKVNVGKGPALYKAFFQTQYKVNEKFSVVPGVHFMLFSLNNSFAAEPRLGLSYRITETQKINAGFGLHSRVHPLYYYYYQTRLADGTYITTNKNLDFTKAGHFIVGYDYNILENLRLKTEVYYQHLYNVPVENRTSTFSALNNGAAWGFDIRDSMVNKGNGRNYGIEMTLEKFLGKGYYYLFTASLFESKYTASDDIERNTAFNGNYVFNVVLGKEFKIGQNKTLSFDGKITYAGGKRYTPIDTTATRLAGSMFATYYLDEFAFSKQMSSYLKADLKIGLRVDGKRVSQEWQLFIENITNHKNVLMQSYNKNTNQVENVYQLGLFPMMYYRIYF